MVQYEYINPLNQFGKIHYDLIIRDDEDPSFNFRFNMSFNENISNEELDIIAQDTIAQIKKDIEDKLEVTE